MGKLDTKILRIELREALKAAGAGGLSSVVKIPEGYAILKVVPESAVPMLQNTNPIRLLPLLATGAIKYTLKVSGREETESIFQALPRTDASAQDLPGICRSRNQALAEVTQQLEKRLNAIDPKDLGSAPPAEQIKMYYTEAQLYAYQGDMERAISLWQAAYSIVQSSAPRLLLPMQETLGIAYLHRSEMENDVYRQPDDRCIFPPPTPIHYRTTQDSEKAVQYFLKYLDRQPDDLEVRWLLTLAYTTLGQYPANVLPKYVIPPSVFASKEIVGRFRDVAQSAGLSLSSLAGGVIVDDFDNDGWLDVIVSSTDPCEPLHFFHNNGDGPSPIVPLRRALAISLAA